MEVYLVDGTYELFRYYYGVPSRRAETGKEVGAALGVLGSVLALIDRGVTHVGVATDHVVTSFRNDLWPGYKDGSDIDPELLAQFPLLEEGLAAMGVRVWPMEEYEADDGLAAAARMAADDHRVKQVVICTPDKDLAQCVRGQRVVMLDRRRDRVTDEPGVRERFGVGPASIPDYLALVGDSADGFPGLPGWGPKSAATLLARYEHLDRIPASPSDWDVEVRGADRLARALREGMDDVLLFRRLATLREDAPVSPHVDDLEWLGPEPSFEELCDRLGEPALPARAREAVARRI